MTEEVQDRQFDPAVEPELSTAWLNLIDDAERKFQGYHDRCDRIDELYADLDRRSDNVRDPEFAMFWANVQVLAPSVYARPPVPVVVPEFKERDPVKRLASELLERCLVKSFDLDDMDGTMRLVRDDMLLNGRGVPWVRYDNGDGEKACVEFLDRKDFLHDPARNWKEVGWVARRAWLTRKEGRERFSAEKIANATFIVQKNEQPDGATDPREKMAVWEIWSKTHDKVVWVTEGVEELLDEGKPHLRLEGFFPCPKPAYTTLQRRSLVPVPDMLFYRDQLDEINKLTRRIHALSEAIQVKGFYPAGGEIGDAIETALQISDDRRIMVPVSNMAAFGGGGDVIVWLPIDVIATTIAGLIEMRRQVIDDVYQITGLSDIMRGESDARETLGAQELKSQYGSIRIREKQSELVRVARDCARIVGEIMAENFRKDTLLDLSQMEIPTRADIQRQVGEIEAQVRQARSNPQIAQQAQENPEEAQKALDQAAQQIAELESQATVEDVIDLLRDQRIRPFALDIETDSTIQPDENAEKQARAEFLEALGGTMQQLAPLIQQMPQAAGFAGEILKFALAPFRAGRELESAVDDFVDQMMQQAGGEPPPDPETIKAQAEAQKMQMEMQMKQAEAQAQAEAEERKAQMEIGRAQFDARLKQEQAQAESERKVRETEAQREANAQLHTQAMEKAKVEIEKARLSLAEAQERRAFQAQQAQAQMESTEQQAELRERESEQKADLAERTAKQKAK